MRIFISGVSGVGKTSIGFDLAKLLGYKFFDFDEEVEKYYGMAIEHLQEKYQTMDLFRQKASIVLRHIISSNGCANSVIALPPSGLMGVYWEVVNESPGIIINLKDTASNILERIEFYDKDSKLINKKLSKKENKYYLSEIKKDMIYYNNSFNRANHSVSIEGLNVSDAAIKIQELLSNSIPDKHANKILNPTV
jgi:shikimate kinase